MIFEIRKCPCCGSKKLRFSSLYSQMWFECRTNTKGKMTKLKKVEYPYGETHIVVSCADCDFVEEGLDVIRINEKGHLCIDTEDYTSREIEKIEETYGVELL